MEQKNAGETELIQALRKGSVKAFDALYDLYFQRIYSYCFQFTKSHKDTEDIVQEVFIKLWLARGEIKNDETIGPILFRMAKNHLVSAHRAMLGRPQYVDYLEYLETVGQEDTGWMEYHEFARGVERAIASLPPAQQRIFRLSRQGQLSGRQIAELLGVSEQTVKNQLTSSLRSIRIFLNTIAKILILFIISSII